MSGKATDMLLAEAHRCDEEHCDLNLHICHCVVQQYYNYTVWPLNTELYKQTKDRKLYTVCMWRKIQWIYISTIKYSYVERKCVSEVVHPVFTWERVFRPAPTAKSHEVTLQMKTVGYNIYYHIQIKFNLLLSEMWPCVHQLWTSLNKAAQALECVSVIDGTSYESQTQGGFFIHPLLKKLFSQLLWTHSSCKSSLFQPGRRHSDTEWRRLLIRRISTFRLRDRRRGGGRQRRGGGSRSSFIFMGQSERRKWQTDTVAGSNSFCM